MKLRLTRPAPAKTFVLTRIDLIIGRSYSISGFAVSLEAVVNGFGQLGNMRAEWFFAMAGVIMLGYLVLAVVSWSRPPDPIWYRVMALIHLVVFLSWPLQLQEGALPPPDSRPWVWWLLGIAILAGGLGFQNLLGVVYWISVPLLWLALHPLPQWGGGDLATALIDAGFVFFITAALLAIVYALRYESSKTDAANQVALDAAIDRARKDAIERERDRVDALVHDSVLTTLILAAASTSQEEELAAADLARNAVLKLVAAEGDRLEQQSSASSFLGALADQAMRQFPGVELDVRISGIREVPGEVAAAATEATIQVLENSIRHAGDGAERALRLRGSAGGFKIIATDNGRGFRFGSVPKNRLGLRLSVIQRMEAVGGRVKIDSAPGRGTNVVIEWSAPADDAEAAK